jgi:hypothetical protein
VQGFCWKLAESLAFSTLQLPLFLFSFRVNTPQLAA